MPFIVRLALQSDFKCLKIISTSLILRRYGNNAEGSSLSQISMFYGFMQCQQSVESKSSANLIPELKSKAQ
jgi:hypothetical protein